MRRGSSSHFSFLVSRFSFLPRHPLVHDVDERRVRARPVARRRPGLLGRGFAAGRGLLDEDPPRVLHEPLVRPALLTSALGYTRVGSDCMLMAYTHVAHDCRLGNHVILSNAVNMAGHVTIGDWAIVTPPFSFIQRIPCVPSEPVPESTIPMASASCV